MNLRNSEGIVSTFSDEGGIARRTGIAEEEGVANAVAEEEIKISVTVDITKGRSWPRMIGNYIVYYSPCRRGFMLRNTKGIVAPFLCVGGSACRACVAEEVDIAVTVADEEIKISVIVNIG